MSSTFEVRVTMMVPPESFDRFARCMTGIVERRVPRGSFSIEKIGNGFADIRFRIDVNDSIDFEVVQSAMRGIMYAIEKESDHA